MKTQFKYEQKRIIEILTLSFKNDPVMTFLFKNNKNYNYKLNKLFKYMIDFTYKYGNISACYYQNLLKTKYIINYNATKNKGIKYKNLKNIKNANNDIDIDIDIDKVTGVMLWFSNFHIYDNFFHQFRLSLFNLIFSLNFQEIKKFVKYNSITKNIKSKLNIKKDIYLLAIGVHPDYQKMGMGTYLLNYLINSSTIMRSNIFLETSNKRNLIFYKNLGFQLIKSIYINNHLDVYFLKRFYKNIDKIGN